VEILPVPPQIDDWVPHELARAVKGHVSAALHLEDLYAPSLELRWRERETAGPGAAPDRDHRIVLHQEEEIIRDFPGNALPAEGPL
jgi:hypothetical protein